VSGTLLRSEPIADRSRFEQITDFAWSCVLIKSGAAAEEIFNPRTFKLSFFPTYKPPPRILKDTREYDHHGEITSDVPLGLLYSCLLWPFVLRGVSEYSTRTE
jgi:hypothetical protein